MANHGFAVVGESVLQAVYRAVYTHINAGIQANAILINSAQENSHPDSTRPLHYLDEQQISGGATLGAASASRPWELWVREVESCPLYKNEVDRASGFD